MKTFKERNARVKHNQCSTKIVIMGNAHTHQLVRCESKVEISRRLASVIDSWAADRSRIRSDASLWSVASSANHGHASSTRFRRVLVLSSPCPSARQNGFHDNEGSCDKSDQDSHIYHYADVVQTPLINLLNITHVSLRLEISRCYHCCSHGRLLSIEKRHMSKYEELKSDTSITCDAVHLTMNTHCRMLTVFRVEKS